jgi:hypothetical protein
VKVVSATGLGQKWPRPRSAVSAITPATASTAAATAPAVSQIQGEPDLNQSRMLLLPRAQMVWYFSRRRWRTSSAAVLTKKVKAKSTSADRNSSR